MMFLFGYLVIASVTYVLIDSVKNKTANVLLYYAFFIILFPIEILKTILKI